MNLDYFIARFSANRQVFASLLRGVTDEQARWKPSSDKWSMLEVVNHLYDEEREDFRARLKSLLEDPQQEWAAIKPQQWPVERRYNERELAASLDNFLKEREESLAWLKGLSEPSWENRYTHPRGTLSAGDLLASWLAHDFLHVRQLARLHWQYVGALADPYQTAYGGPWQES